MNALLVQLVHVAPFQKESRISITTILLTISYSDNSSCSFSLNYEWQKTIVTHALWQRGMNILTLEAFSGPVVVGVKSAFMFAVVSISAFITYPGQEYCPREVIQQWHNYVILLVIQEGFPKNRQ